MPYIKRTQRVKLDRFLQPILAEIYSGSGEKFKNITSGELNFFISSIIWTLFEENPSYDKANELIGVLECVKQEFIRRKLSKYEDQKIKENGDI